jgi:cytochrome c-type biogenesis protein CcmF
VFVLGTIYSEFHRGIKSRVKFRGESVLQSIASLFVINNRRYGGYIVHLGFALIVIGIVISSFFRQTEEMTLAPNVKGQVGDYTVEVAPFDPRNDQKAAGPGQPYNMDAATFRIHDSKGGLVASLRPERHYYVKTQNMLSTPAISRNFANDYYVHYAARDPGGKVTFTVFINPLVNWIWAGWLLMIAGGILAILPMPARRIGLVE